MRIWIFLFLSFLAVSAQAQYFSSTFFQPAYGWANRDFQFGTDTENGNMALLTLDHVGTWKWGGHYFFINYSIGPFVDYDFATGARSRGVSDYRIYSEYSPWLSFQGLFGWHPWHKVWRDLSIEGSINIAYSGYHAWLGGLGMEFNLPQGYFLKAIFYYKNQQPMRDLPKDEGLQITLVYDITLLKKPGIRLQGFADIQPKINDFWGFDFLAQPRLLLDVGQWLIPKQRPRTWEIGIDWYLHFNDQLSVSVPQPAIRFTW
ncbi:hypothetical protein [Pontibacter sp. G13]|uniref:hypothetical protein n=1 Tax=Pontibacter sp. G13 TaxID=3074898 RepID=UPI00288AA363|nr:hypothetical protein [Pontibacter sp. G13]WNJ19995.1 hypothetical protein RJD25_05885 [Pontibacter sp. G13]